MKDKSYIENLKEEISKLGENVTHEVKYKSLAKCFPQVLNSIEKGEMEFVREFFENTNLAPGENFINQTDNDETKIHNSLQTATIYGQHGIMNLLLDNGAKTYHSNRQIFRNSAGSFESQCKTAIAYAIDNKDIKAINILCQRPETFNDRYTHKGSVATKVEEYQYKDDDGKDVLYSHITEYNCVAYAEETKDPQIIEIVTEAAKKADLYQSKAKKVELIKKYNSTVENTSNRDWLEIKANYWNSLNRSKDLWIDAVCI
ncbi:MAG: hypothetical protein EOP34_11385, partial [Rickettsiales bacterium]